ncbi:uncharacterized protein FOMMEDRAFT_94838 [Fomitiporia mediterranea MF3/22]|uniref:uncharacterized protein n=1 Tax=Fomitiporia mediterranea (strain MF3/22) TaxID=694068 RepID=UPI00044076EB|nr:uncharacterized protein FOMMEDRAFT_94838 [Fomitiporia mediterranea MF3/22]EJC99010.1 hypothetical protein FOMMEDRAFT_94838 [Fomitiporia mediterranea MF3/22]
MKHKRAVEEAELIDTLCDNDFTSDDSQLAHDAHVATTIHDKAIQQMQSARVTVSADELQSAELILSKVIAGLAKKINDSNSLKEWFEKLIDAEVGKNEPLVNGNKRMLAQRVATCWNSDFACLQSYLSLYPIVEQLTGVQHLKLQSFILNASQLSLAKELCHILAILEEPTRLFSQAEVPLIADVIPMFLEIRQALECASKDENLPSILRIAAQASILVCDKYFTLTGECEVYFIAIAMSPDKKLEWFAKKNFPANVVQEIHDLVIHRWEVSYKHLQAASSSSRISTNPQPLVSLNFFII